MLHGMLRLYKQKWVSQEAVLTLLQKHAQVCTIMQRPCLLPTEGNAGQPRQTACPHARPGTRQQCPIGLARVCAARSAAEVPGYLSSLTPLLSEGEIDALLFKRKMHSCCI